MNQSRDKDQVGEKRKRNEGVGKHVHSGCGRKIDKHHTTSAGIGSTPLCVTPGMCARQGPRTTHQLPTKHGYFKNKLSIYAVFFFWWLWSSRKDCVASESGSCPLFNVPPSLCCHDQALLFYGVLGPHEQGRVHHDVSAWFTPDGNLSLSL